MNISSFSPLAQWCDALQSERSQTILFWLLMAALSILLVAPLWIITYLPLGDLPDHAGQIHAILNFSEYQNDYKINWFTPYLVGYSISLLFGLVVSATTALKITCTLAVLAIPFATAQLARVLGLNRFWVIPSFAAACSFSFYWGFFSFVVATPITIAFFAFCVSYSQKPQSLRLFALAAVFSLFLFFAHAMAWAFAMVIAAAIIFIHNGLEGTKNKLLPFIVLLPLVFYWVYLNGANQPAQPNNLEFGKYSAHLYERTTTELKYISKQFNERTTKGEHGQRAAEMLGFSIGRPPFGDFVIIALLLLAWPYFLGAKITRQWRRWLPFISLVLIYMIVPYWIFDTAYVNTRFAAFLLPLSLFLFEQDPAKNMRRDKGVLNVSLRWLLGLGLTALILFGNYNLFASFKDNDRDFKAILEKMEPNKMVLALMANQDSKLIVSPPFMHYGSYYQAEKGGMVLPSFPHDPVAHNVPMRYKHDFWPVHDTWQPNLFEWEKHGGARYDYFLVRADKPMDYLFAHSNGKVSLVERQGLWWLYKQRKD